MKTIKDLKQMLSAPADRKYFEKHGNPLNKALEKKKSRSLTSEESKEKTKNWPKGPEKAVDKALHQKKFGRSYDD